MVFGLAFRECEVFFFRLVISVFEFHRVAPSTVEAAENLQVSFSKQAAALDSPGSIGNTNMNSIA